MKVFSFYHCETGAVHAQRFSTDLDPVHHPHLFRQLIAANTPADHVAIEAALDREAQRMNVATGELVAYQPPAPSTAHEWDTASKRWTLTAAATAAQAARSTALAKIRALEGSQGRAVREAALGVPGAVDRLRSLDERIAALREPR
ncbi:MAG: hypothetical protein ACLPQ6_03310 [Steroidobacteraceae bacterium]